MIDLLCFGRVRAGNVRNIRNIREPCIAQSFCVLTILMVGFDFGEFRDAYASTVFIGFTLTWGFISNEFARFVSSLPCFFAARLTASANAFCPAARL